MTWPFCHTSVGPTTASAPISRALYGNRDADGKRPSQRWERLHASSICFRDARHSSSTTLKVTAPLPHLFNGHHICTTDGHNLFVDVIGLRISWSQNSEGSAIHFLSSLVPHGRNLPNTLRRRCIVYRGKHACDLAVGPRTNIRVSQRHSHHLFHRHERSGSCRRQVPVLTV